jgi:hypothetical protein
MLVPQFIYHLEAPVGGSPTVSYKDEVVACDFFTVETAWLKTVYVLFFSAPRGA